MLGLKYWHQQKRKEKGFPEKRKCHTTSFDFSIFLSSNYEMFEAWEKGDCEAWKEGVAPEYVWYIPSRSTEPLSREETIEEGKMMLIAFPDVTFSIEEMIAVRGKVITRYIVRGTHQGEYQGIPATGNKFESSGIMISRVENGKVVEDREESDHLGMMMQLGYELTTKKD